MSNAMIMAMLEQLKAGGGNVYDSVMFGDGSDGDFDSTGDVVFTVPTDDTHYVVKNYKNFTLNTGHTLSIDKRNKGLIICCTGDVVINGIIDNNNKAAQVIRNAGGTIWETYAAISIKPKKLPLQLVDYLIPAGGSGGKGGGGTWDAYSTEGSNGAFGGSGGGGGGTAYVGGSPSQAGGGGGGAGNGGNGGYTSSPTLEHNGKAGGGNGGAGSAGGGTLGGVPGQNGGDGGGGIIIIIAKGDVTIGNTGIISAKSTGKGGDGGSATSTLATGSSFGGGGGGGAGGGVVLIAIRGLLVNNGLIDVSGSSGGAGGTFWSGAAQKGAGKSGMAGQIGTIIIKEV